MSRAWRFQNSATGIVVICALVVTGLVVRREFAPPPAVSGAIQGVVQPYYADHVVTRPEIW